MIRFAVSRDRTGTVTDVEDADLAALEEIMGAEIGPDINTFVDGHFLMHRHTAQCDHAVHMAVDGHDLIGLVQAGDQHLIAGLLRRIALEIALIAGIANIHTAAASLTGVCL